MKRTFCLSLTVAVLLIVLFVVSGCGGDDSPVVPENPGNGTIGFTMTVTPDTIRRPADTVSVSYFNVQLSEPFSFYAKAEKDWVLLSDAEGNGASSYKVAVRTVSNRESEPRISKVSFYSGNATQYAYVWQEAAKDEQMITVTPDTLYIDAEKGSKGTVTFGLIDDSEYIIGENSWFSQEEKREGKTLQITYTALREWEEDYQCTMDLLHKDKVANFVLVQKAKQSTGEDDGTYDITITPDKHAKDASSERIFSLVDIDRETAITVTSDADWCTPHDANFDIPSKQFKLYMDVSVNMGKESRTATVTVKAGSSTKTCTVTQEGGYSGKLEIGGTIAEAVDLGLSVKWASHNLGASKAEEAGPFFAWGETKPKEVYGEDNYAYYDVDYADYIDIGENIAGTEYDAAHVQWGNGWCMPTWEQFNELINKCTWQWGKYNGVNGYKVTAPNGNSIIFPAAGFRYNKSHFNDNKVFVLWTSDLVKIFGGRAYAMKGDSENRLQNNSPRFYGYNIRPVKKKGSNSGNDNGNSDNDNNGSSSGGTGTGNAGGGVANIE